MCPNCGYCRYCGRSGYHWPAAVPAWPPPPKIVWRAEVKPTNLAEACARTR